MPLTADRLLPGRPYPIGATWDGLGVNFAVFSANASKIELCLFNPSGRQELKRLPLPECTDEIWHGYLPDAQPGLLYGYRAYGAYEPAHGHRFNPNKLLLDPYARAVSGALRWSDVLFGYRLHSARGDLSFDRRDSAAAMPKAVVVDPAYSWGDDRRPEIPLRDTVIYEAHLKGLTMRRPELTPNLRGTFAGLIDDPLIEHMVKLGITTLELMPVQAFLQDRFLVERGLRNYWGYSTLGFFMPEPSYLATGHMNEVRTAVRRLHAAGIEVILDVVYNHTCEGSELGPTLSFRGLDNASYYRLPPGSPRHCINDTGCGNTLNLSHPRVLQMVLDSLRYWAETFHVDGFRFDLAVTLGREEAGFDPGAGFFDAIRQDPVLAPLKLIGEPWDPGPGGYQLGNLPSGFCEWNDRFRDGVRRFWRGDANARPELAARLSGSGDIFDRDRRRPQASINFVTSHDGFTLRDLVSYQDKHNEANGEDNRDGHDANYSLNCGAEGETDDQEILDQRARLQRAMLATVMLAQGTPMLLAGDEFGRTQQGNNNGYCQDNELSWLDWAAAESPEGRALTAFVGKLAELRRQLGIFRHEQFLHGNPVPDLDIPDLSWWDERGQPLSVEDWQNPEGRALAMRIACCAPPEVVLILINGAAADLAFDLPEPRFTWQRLLDTATGDTTPAPAAEPVSVAAHSLILLKAEM